MATPPSDFICPIAKKIMQDPVSTLHGNSYEKDAILKWIKDGHEYCPVTGAFLDEELLKPNKKLQWKIRYWLHKNNSDTSATESKTEATTVVIPQSRFVCPLTKEIMVDPVMTKYGHNYERSAILQWLEKHGNICPVSGKPLQLSHIISNGKLAWEIENWKVHGPPVLTQSQRTKTHRKQTRKSTSSPSSATDAKVHTTVAPASSKLSEMSIKSSQSNKTLLRSLGMSTVDDSEYKLRNNDDLIAVVDDVLGTLEVRN